MKHGWDIAAFCLFILAGMLLALAITGGGAA